jgi:hypothetical protein
MQNSLAEQAVHDSIRNNDRRYIEGLAKLNELRAHHQNLNSQQLESSIVSIHEHQIAGHSVPQQRSLETSLLEKGRDRALEEFRGHQVKADAYLILSGRYHELGLESKADAYKERGTLERATTRGFQAIIEAYDKKLTALGVSNPTIEELNRRQAGYRDLESAEKFLESYKGDYNICCEHTIEVQKAEETLQKLNAQPATNSLTPAEKNQFEKETHQRDKFMRMAENEALNAATSFRHFQSEIQSTEKSYDSFSREPIEQPLQEHEDPLQEPTATGSEHRMNRLAVGMVVCQTLKVLDHEL